MDRAVILVILNHTGAAKAHDWACERLAATNVDAFAAPAAASTSFQAVLHLVCCVHREGVLYELDGLKTARCHSDTPREILSKVQNWRLPPPTGGGGKTTTIGLPGIHRVDVCAETWGWYSSPPIPSSPSTSCPYFGPVHICCRFRLVCDGSERGYVQTG